MSDSATDKGPRDGRNSPAVAISKTGSSGPGAHSLAEICSQTQCWESCLREFSQSERLRKVEDQFGRNPEWIFIGCGSSYYAALAAAATMKSLTGRPSWAVPASEILLYPELALPKTSFVPVLISRSGRTSEVLKAAEMLQQRGVSSLAISCTAGELLEELASVTITLPADEKSTVMTRSFTSMLLALQFLAGRIAGESAFCDALIKMPQMAAPALATVQDAICGFVARHAFANYVCLGHGPFYGLACEYALKVTEMSLSTAQVFHSLEFRHGPRSIVTPDTLLIFLLSEQGYPAECDLLEEVKSLGGTTMVIANHADSRVRAAANLLVELQLPLHESVRLAPSLVPGQLLALHTGLKKGLDPDVPRYLTRAVILNKDDTQKFSQKPEPVA